MKVRTFLEYAKPYRNELFGAAALMIAETVFALAVPWLSGRFAFGLLSNGTDAGRTLLELLGIFAAQAAVRFASSYLISGAAAAFMRDLRVRIYERLQSLPISFHHQRRLGDLMAILGPELSQLTSFITGTLPAGLPLVLTAMGAVALMFRLDMVLAGLVTLLVPVFYTLAKVLGRSLRPLGQQLQKAEATALALAHENLSMLPAIKLFTREPEECARYAADAEAVRSLSVRQTRIYAALQPAIQFIGAASVVLLLWLAKARFGSGQMNTPQLVSFFLYALLLTRPMGGLANLYGQSRMAGAVLERLDSLFEERPEPLSSSLPKLVPVGGQIEFRNVTFAYPNRPPVFANLNLAIRANECVAITGKNGAGKSTLVNLLLRLHEPDAGNILIDGTDVSSVNLRSLRAQIAVVPQNVFLFNGTVRDNIAFGRSGTSHEDIHRAAELAEADEFISRLPGGYDCVIGDRGVRLSGGQRQRLALARALLKDPAILILDEATAMFDPDGEHSFVERCRAAMPRRTIIVITHRPASLSMADRVVRLEAGSVTTLREHRLDAAPALA